MKVRTEVEHVSLGGNDFLGSFFLSISLLHAKEIVTTSLLLLMLKFIGTLLGSKNIMLLAIIDAHPSESHRQDCFIKDFATFLENFDVSGELVAVIRC